MTMAVNSIAALCRKCCNAWERARRAPSSPPPARAVGRHGGVVYKIGRGAPAKSRRVAPERLDTRLPIFLLACRVSTHDTTGLTPAKLLFREELRLPYDLLFGASPDEKWPTIHHAADIVDRLHDIHNYTPQHLKPPSDRMKARYDRLANSAGFQEGIKYGCIGQPALKASHPSFNPSGRVPTG
jgi:hypothetical protein